MSSSERRQKTTIVKSGGGGGDCSVLTLGSVRGRSILFLLVTRVDDIRLRLDFRSPPRLFQSSGVRVRVGYMWLFKRFRFIHGRIVGVCGRRGGRVCAGSVIQWGSRGTK